jgi:hypothetical protein
VVCRLDLCACKTVESQKVGGVFEAWKRLYAVEVGLWSFACSSLDSVVIRYRETACCIDERFDEGNENRVLVMNAALSCIRDVILLIQRCLIPQPYSLSFIKY